MCGIFGFIGTSKNQAATTQLVNSLLLKTESRGENATGFWACEHESPRLFFDKEPVKASVYATRSIWRDDFCSSQPDLLIMHCRQPTTGVGHERVNKNNHPHVSSDKTIALVHNGRITDYSALKNRYLLHSDCDSEILLGMFEVSDIYRDKTEDIAKQFPELPLDMAIRMMGLKEIFSKVHYSHMAVAIGERPGPNRRRLWLFRNEERPLHLIDLRETLGQIFFCSTLEIWVNSVEASPLAKPYIHDDVIEPKVDQIWIMEIEYKDGEEDTWVTKKFKINKTKFYDWPEEDNERLPRAMIPNKENINIISRLNKEEDIIDTPRKATAALIDSGGRNATSGSTGLQTISTDTPVKVTTTEDMFMMGSFSKFKELLAENKKILTELEAMILVNKEDISAAQWDDICKSLQDAIYEINSTCSYMLKLSSDHS